MVWQPNIFWVVGDGELSNSIFLKKILFHFAKYLRDTPVKEQLKYAHMSRKLRLDTISYHLQSKSSRERRSQERLLLCRLRNIVCPRFKASQGHVITNHDFVRPSIVTTKNAFVLSTSPLYNIKGGRITFITMIMKEFFDQFL